MYGFHFIVYFFCVKGVEDTQVSCLFSAKLEEVYYFSKLKCLVCDVFEACKLRFFHLVWI